MDGIYFYSFFWIVWVIATFFMKKTAWRTMVAAAALITIIFSSVSLNIGGFQITLSFLFLFFLSCYYAAKQSRRKLVYMAIAVLTIAFAYTSFQLLVFFDPVWIWMDHRWMLAILLVILCFLFYENIQSRLLCLVIGSCQGEMLYSIISQKISFSYIIGSYSFLDTVSLSACCTFIWALVDYIPVYIDGKKPIRGTRQP
ncbi:YphA family membrane protein [Saccharococcus caldoxylosilyticus]|jgi:hypothetical protein|uniref:Uncharacterized protein n=1 Tax=Parageobacillus caldoxylosilyticus NBRC 107762 TaxID=1220594 RepID=A0A023DFZ3_9BACL|nr:hypothetical protein [Parageobacillus caldoxylosilyticus]OQP02940.1 hypothetical protein BSK33_09580 [Geobacillus sp. 44B]MBB3853476.1 hypothetical protein [Parageobacillus caldoxylosilyticus]QNU36634.1 hypothetical protein IC801_12050 [Geobacillus sp. 44B]QXJ39824.1 hypothetical protein BV455_03190 [Parageobacillus caldoxylosilyticus]GAJ40224.1 hypothetical protein GCA01S_033_00690 [Parageobacillus caldoxylosilyticus NBRC 107762]